MARAVGAEDAELPHRVRESIYAAGAKYVVTAHPRIFECGSILQFQASAQSSFPVKLHHLSQRPCRTPVSGQDEAQSHSGGVDCVGIESDLPACIGIDNIRASQGYICVNPAR